MALAKSYTNPQGFTHNEAYWKVIDYRIDTVHDAITFTVAPYPDARTRERNPDGYYMDGACRGEYPLDVVSEYADPREALYAQLKAGWSEFSDAIDV